MTGFLIWLASSRHGARRLGSQDDRPEFSTWSWMAMLFCAGIGAGLLYWSTIEWAFYIDSPPFDLAPGSVDAGEWAATYGMFHWGVSAWCIYCFPAVVIGYQYYRKRVPFLRLSTGLHALIAPGDDLSGYDRWPARLVDVIYIIALVGGTGTSIGLVSPMIAACFSRLTGMPESLGLSLLILLLCVILFGTSVYLGLERGIRRLSDFNAVLAIALALTVLVLGPTIFILEATTNSIGLMLQNFFRMNTYTDPIGRTGFVKDWTVFYWAWWIAYGPFMGLFVTRISKGRTLRQMIFSMLGFGTLGCTLFYGVFGNYSLWLDLEGKANIREMVADDRAAAAVAETLAQLPLAPLMLAAFIVVAFIFVATTYDSGSYTIAAAATRNLRAGVEPARWHRVFWAMALGILPATLIFVGGLRTVQSVVLVVSLPVMVVLVLMTWSFLRILRLEEEAERARDGKDTAPENTAS
jgi:BCCT family betaine/carnitine transporter